MAYRLEPDEAEQRFYNFIDTYKAMKVEAERLIKHYTDALYSYRRKLPKVQCSICGKNVARAYRNNNPAIGKIGDHAHCIKWSNYESSLLQAREITDMLYMYNVRKRLMTTMFLFSSLWAISLTAAVLSNNLTMKGR